MNRETLKQKIFFHYVIATKRGILKIIFHCLQRILHFKTQFSKICVKNQEFIKNICEKISGNFLI